MPGATVAPRRDPARRGYNPAGKESKGRRRAHCARSDADRKQRFESRPLSRVANREPFASNWWFQAVGPPMLGHNDVYTDTLCKGLYRFEAATGL